MKISGDASDMIVTYSLGSCIGVAIHDAVAGVGGLLHFQLPMSNGDRTERSGNPFIYANTGIPLFFKEAYRAGAEKRRLVVKVAGGSNMFPGDDFFMVGKRNYLMMRKMFWRNGVLITSEDVGESATRTMRLDVGTGKVEVKKDGEWFVL